MQIDKYCLYLKPEPHNQTSMENRISFVSADEAVKVVKSGDHVHLSSVASAPRTLIDALCPRGEAGELKNVRIHHLHTEGPAPYSDPKFDGIFFHQGFFIGANVRKSVLALQGQGVVINYKSKTKRRAHHE